MARDPLKSVQFTPMRNRGYDGCERSIALGAAGVESKPRRREGDELRYFIVKLEGWAAWTVQDAIDWDDVAAVAAFLGELDGMAALIDSCRHSTWARIAELNDEGED